MKLHDALMNLAITAALVLVFALIAVLLNKTRPMVPKAVPLSAAEMAGFEAGARPMTEAFEALTQVALVDTRANEADTLRLRVGHEEHVFVLYFVDAVEASWTHPQRINDQARWFGNVSSQAIVETGAEALEYVRTLLTTKPFRVLTRWERVPNTIRYHALIIVEYEPGKPVYLADLLMRAGYARVSGTTTELPGDSRDVTSYQLELKQLGERASEEKRGIWSRAP